VIFNRRRERATEFIEERQHGDRRKALGHAGVAAKIGEQHRGARRMDGCRRPHPRDDNARRAQPGRTPYSPLGTHALRYARSSSFIAMLPDRGQRPMQFTGTY